MSGEKAKNILIADDGEISRLRVSKTLITEGHSVKLTKDVDGAIEALRKSLFDYDLLILNLQRSSEDPIGVLQWMKSNGRIGRPQVLVVLRAEDSGKVLTVIKDLGVREFISKGIATEELIIRANKILDNDKKYSERTRVSTNIPIDFADGFRMLTGNMINISETGVYICSSEDFLRKDVLNLRFFLPENDKVIEAEGEVVWGEKLDDNKGIKNGIGVQFTRIDPENKNLIASFVRNELNIAY
ncbi:MAG: PilZ domain-containing protein [Thermodesulfobacteriota bacterium]